MARKYDVFNKGTKEEKKIENTNQLFACLPGIHVIKSLELAVDGSISIQILWLNPLQKKNFFLSVFIESIIDIQN